MGEFEWGKYLRDAGEGALAGGAMGALGGPLAPVTATGGAIIGGVRTSVSDENGQYRIVDLRPGTYTVSFVLPGFTTVKREGVELQGSMTATINADLRIGGVGRTILRP